MSTYLALTFGTLLSSQGTDTSFKPLSQALRALRSFFLQLIRSGSVPFPTRFRCFQPYQVFRTARPQEAFVVTDLTACPTS
jgi:hypothetical protein